MSLSIASTVARRGRQPKSIRPVALGSLGSATVSHGNRQQTRGYKFGRLSSYLEPYIRHHSHRYREDFYRRRAWDNQSLAEYAKSTIQRVVHNYWSPECRGRFGAGRYLNTDAAPKKTPDNPTGVRPGQNIEDAERGPLEHLLFGDAKSQSAKNTGRSGQEDANSDYVIDPITNRKVPRKTVDTSYSTADRGAEIPVRTTMPYRSQFGSLRPPEVDKTRTPVFSDSPTSGTQKLPFVNHYGTPHGTLLDTLNLEHKEVRWHRDDTIASATSMAASWSRSSDVPEYPDLHRYTAVRYQEPDGKPADKQSAQKPADLAKYGPVRAHEPDGKYKAESAAPAKPEDLDKYGPVRAHEPDGKYKIESKAAVEPQELDNHGVIESHQAEAEANDRAESSVSSEELGKYGAVRSHEPDGKYKLDSESPVNPEELAKYKAVRSHEPDGKYKLESESSVDPAELKQYGAVRSHEPDGKYKLQSESSVDPEELRKYGAVRSHEPDGKYKLEAEGTSSVDPEELAKYGAVRSHEPDGKYKDAAEYIETPDEAELAAYRKPVLAHEPDGLYAANHVQPEYDAEELAKYQQPFFSHEPDGKYAASYVEPPRDEAELFKYGAFRSHEPDGKYAANYNEEKPDPGELATYGPYRSHEPDGMYALRNNVSVSPAETQRYRAFRSHEPDGKYAPEAQAAREAQDLANHEAFTYEDAETRPLPRSEPKELRKYQAVLWSEPDGKPVETDGTGQTLVEDSPIGDTAKQEQKPFRRKVQELMAQAAAESDALEADKQATQEANIKNNRDQKRRHLTGNYVRDFPEEFSKSWATEIPQASSSPLSLEQKSSESTIQPALDRYNSKDSGDGRLSSSRKSDPTSPVLYKVLVYDPTTECIRTAETASTVRESTAPLTPAEILLRISNPAKFFPHFGPLQAQGFEMVSGSGDVLIFRKVRDAVPAAAEATSSTPHASAAAAAPIGEERTPPPAGIVGRKGKRSLPKKVAMGAACLAGSAYSVGVVSEYFRNGGIDGTGPKGF
ncbi:hypothetical protein MYCTH_2310410 [Thermothelomyces thermophilus ATCC 42464]|uniref:Uncharacterized protein n=1 Tax=Thermothelomyces thermophilus (strain ATCC 42464 / BCRC 31852 / DSM 1799) TaxID=573729 RepID=G2QLH1_THET4|nr:uncharacterized protein MYCTH_2310410 [Thermothelomyces thermophilus ATCC 42464]AEO60802.1 hypothetical protein MYCTH_2310410 [Thermothelomyces thermophilus ATCC 42464]